MIDIHVHSEAYNYQDMELMSLSGIKAVISNTYYPHMVEITTQKIEDFFERLTSLQSWLLEMNFIRLFVACGVNPMSVPVDYEVFIKRIPDYLIKKDIFVAIGEVGIDHRSETCRDLKIQENILKEQLYIAKKHNMPVIIHTPPESVESGIQAKWLDAGNRAEEIIERDLDLVKEVGNNPNLIVIDHLSSRKMIEKVINFGAHAGVTIQPWRNLTPGQIIPLIKDFDPSRILVSSDFGPLRSECLAVPKVALEMKKAGFSGDAIRKITMDNPCSLFKLPL